MGATWSEANAGVVSMVDRSDQLPYVDLLFSAELVHLNGSAVIALVGELDLDTAAELRRALDPFLEAGPTEIVLSLSGLSFIDSSGLAELVFAQRRLRQQGRRLSVRSPRANAIKVFEISGLMDVLNVALSPEAR
jgi:anti-sigma B factor antagonist